MMKQHRSAFLVTKSMKQYLVASVIGMAVFNMNAMIDEILMGNFLGLEALAAINLCMPVVCSIAALGTLLSGGAVLISATALGEMNRKRVNDVFTISSVAQWIVCLVLLVTAGPLSGILAGLVSSVEELTPLCEKYIRVLLMGSAVLLYANSFASFVDVCGYPKKVTVIMSLSVVANILMDILFVKVLGMDIGGAAWASVAGSFVSILGLLVFTLRKKNLLKLTFPVERPFVQLGEIVVKSIAQVIGVVATMMLQLICNIYVQNAQGKNGLVILSIGYSILGVSSMVAGGMSSAFTAIGGLMVGQKDYKGLRYLFRRGMLICLTAGIGFLLISLLVPRPLAGLFGANTEELQTMAARDLPLICSFILCITVLLPCSEHFEVMGRLALSSMLSLSVIASILISCLVVSAALPKDQIWLIFPMACILCMLALFGSAFVIKLAAGNKVTFPDLIPDEETDVRKLDLSVPCTREGYEAGMRELWDWLYESKHSELTPRIAHCVEELLLNTIRHSGGDASHDIDLLLREEAGEVTALLKDDGAPFNTSVCLSPNKTYGLMLAHHFCPGIEYNYSFGQNMTLMKWQAEENDPADKDA